MRTIRFLFAFIFVMSCFCELRAQDKNVKHVSINYLYRTPAARETLGNPPGSHYLTNQGVGITCGMELTKVWEMGIYCNFFQSEFESNIDPMIFDTRWVASPGIYSRIHLLDVANMNSSHFDLGLDSKIGGTFASGCHLEYAFGLTGQYYPLQHLGISLSAEFGNFTIARLGHTNTSHFQMQGGLTWRW